MKKYIPRYLARNSNAGNLLEIFLISAISSVLIIRVFLQITGYPQLGGGNIHIAHMLWGGILMLIALILVLTFLNRETRTISALIGGLGFGAFIDEIGKFITKDNNYFFEPAIAIIYVIFILLYFLFRYVDKTLNLTKKEYAVNAIEMVKEIVLHDLDTEEKKIALNHIKKSDSKDPIVNIVKNAIEKFEALPAQTTLFTKARKNLRNIYRKIISNSKFAYLVVLFFSIYSIATFIPAGFDLLTQRTFSQWGLFLSAALTTFYVLIGTYLLLEKRRLAAYEMFKISVLVSIFLTQFFLFFKQQVFAVVSLSINIVILNALQYLINQENIRIK